MLPALETVCGTGCGMAACPVLRLLVTASTDELQVFSLPHSIYAQGCGLELLRTMRGTEPFLFQFVHCLSGVLAFTGSTASTRLLLATDRRHKAVHVVDVVRGEHAGFVAPPGTIEEPHAVAARGSKVAVSMGREVRVYEGSDSRWEAVRTIWLGQYSFVHSLRFTGDGMSVVAGYHTHKSSGSVSIFRVTDGSFVQNLAKGLGVPYDVQECEGDVWAILDFRRHLIEFVGGGSGFPSKLGGYGSGDGEFVFPTAMAFVPGLGLVVREFGNRGRLQFFATRDAIAMAAMRTTWMATVARSCSRSTSF